MINQSHTNQRVGLRHGLLAGMFLLVSLGAAAQDNDYTMDSDALRITYLRDGVDLREYSQFFLQPLDLQATRLLPPPWVDAADPRQWRLSEENRQFLKTAYQEAMSAGLEESGEFNVVDDPYRGTLELRVRLLSLSPYAASGEQVTTRGYGELSFEAAMRDAYTGDLLAVFEGTQKVGKEYQENSEFNRGSSLVEHFTQWGRNVSERMSEVHDR